MAAKQTTKTSPLLLPGAILGGVLLLIGGASAGDAKLIILAIVATTVLVWTIVNRRGSE
jgi:hypothetical protein